MTAPRLLLFGHSSRESDCRRACAIMASSRSNSPRSRSRRWKIRATKPIPCLSRRKICGASTKPPIDAMNYPTQLVLNGKLQAASKAKTLPMVNPATEEMFCEVASASTSDVATAAVGAQRAYEKEWRDLKPSRRAEILFRIAQEIRMRAEELAQLEMLNIGKPIADARDEIALGARTFEYYAGAVGKFCGQTIPVGRGGFDFTLRQPMGVVAAIVPWNFPFPIACWKVAPALAAGNAVVLKPASLSPLTALRLGELALTAGLPPGVLQVLAGPGAEIGQALVRHPLVRKIGFTGSTAVGSSIME